MSSISFSKHGYVYSGGVDGIVCHIDAASGNLIRKLRASTKAVSSISVSPGISQFLFQDMMSFSCLAHDVNLSSLPFISSVFCNLGAVMLGYALILGLRLSKI